MRQSFAISSSAFGRGKKISVLFQLCRQNLLLRPNIPPLLNQMGQYQPNMSSADPGVLIQLEHKCWAEKGNSLDVRTQENAGEQEYIISGGHETGWRTGAETLQGPLVDWWQVCWWVRSDSWVWGSPRPLDRHRRMSQIIIIIIIKIQVLFPEE